ncbi:hypothetical protein, partial [Catellatospora sp. NPDC049609]|uniref:hypothetical protein n=1 Tax=Catellatospora sp. NPDC049609 TaxID=3155505 RepID=UPI0034477F7A
GGNAAAVVCADYRDLAWAAQRIALFGNYQAKRAKERPRYAQVPGKSDDQGPGDDGGGAGVPVQRERGSAARRGRERRTG